MYCGLLTEESRLIQIEEYAHRKGPNLPETLKLPSIKPHHLQEARRRLIKQNIHVPESPKTMFLRR